MVTRTRAIQVLEAVLLDDRGADLVFDGHDEAYRISKFPEPPGLPERGTLQIGQSYRVGIDKDGFIRWLLPAGRDPWETDPAPPALSDLRDVAAATPVPPPAAPAATRARPVTPDMLRCSAVKSAAELTAALIAQGSVHGADAAEAALRRFAAVTRQLLLDE